MNYGSHGEARRSENVFSVSSVTLWLNGSMDLIDARSIFSPATGFIRRGGFEWSCNPYLGCTFGCSYCYAMFLPQNRRPKEEWGRWFSAKQNAVALAERTAPKLAGQAVYLSSVTDPYLPAECTLQLTRGILEVLVRHQPRRANPDARAARGPRSRRARRVRRRARELFDPDR